MKKEDKEVKKRKELIYLPIKPLLFKFFLLQNNMNEKPLLSSFQTKDLLKRQGSSVEYLAKLEKI